MNSLLLLGFHHGNERLGEHLHEYIRTHRPELLLRTDYMIANPRAKAQNARYIESDMNRSYTGKNTTLEERRAEQLLKEIRHKDYRIVLDLHTTTCAQPPCFIVADTSANRDFLAASSITKIVEMRHPVVRSSLIGNYQRAVSIEINEEEARQEATLAALCDDIARYLRGETHDKPKHIYEVTELLQKADITPAEAARLRNFTRSPQGFYPILVGENSYKKQTDYLGFKALNYRVNKV